jgi:hypothetical protein
VLRRNPITGIAACWARAADGHAANAPPTKRMNWRRLTVAPEAQTGHRNKEGPNGRDVMSALGH